MNGWMDGWIHEQIDVHIFKGILEEDKFSRVN